ncbi:adenosylmethionine decarboxylase [Micromonospora sp. WMMD1082]|uniref:adenosylmethionine decarboxylase n=1 Tax=Micromonospora sp. WMMD1082 TaxID=3016104 RepID=UPI002417998F|nr:adenosylmethionine decarboxylase [Micromonospora sp. WMMD1082]MDG4795138.1 adenosylmethionine decarboxylase [Micromonospora sp. WMMD1082]
MIHAVFDLTNCRGLATATPEQILTAMRETAERLGCTVRSQLIAPFQPHGATCVLILAESHITVSTWPEHRHAYIDVFTCRADTTPAAAVQPILNLFNGDITHEQHVPRLPVPTTT